MSPVAKIKTQAGQDLVIAEQGYGSYATYQAYCSGCTQETEQYVVTTDSKKKVLDWANEHARNCSFTTV